MADDGNGGLPPLKRAIAVLLLSFAALAQEAPPAVNPEEELSKALFFGQKFADLGEYASAYEQYAKADALKPDQPAVLYNMAVVLARAARYSEAQVKADRYLQLFPEGAEKANIARLQLELEFQRELQKKRQADQNYADVFNRAKFTYTRGELEAALALFRDAEQVRPTDPAPVYNQAVILEKQGNLEAAIERLRRYSELEGDLEKKAQAGERAFGLQRELDDMRTKIVCSFCGRKLPIGATWCERCWHGPYLVKSPVWGSRPCVDGASATRATYYSDQRFSRNDVLPCLWKDGTMLESLRYSAARQRDIQNARKSEGWTYSGDVIQGNAEVRFVQGAGYLERVTSTTGGEILSYAAHEVGQGMWLLDREDLVVDATRYTNRYAYDAEGRIAQQRVDYQNTAACHHLITMTADFAYQGAVLQSVAIKGGYDGYPAEGAPRSDWQAVVTYAYDEKGRVAREEMNVTTHDKMYTLKPDGAIRDELNRVWGGVRVKRQLENVQRLGDICATNGSSMITNAIDLRPFYAMSPNLGVVLPPGVTKAVVTFTYPP